jgi:hypothetical protein
LAEQIDRLDQILDGLADGLNEAVAMAVKEAVSLAVKEAVHAVITEVLTNPVVQETVRGTTVPAVQPVNATPKFGLRGCVARLGGWIAQRVRSVGKAASTLLNRGRQACCKLYLRVRKACAFSFGCVRALRHLRIQMLTALGVGVGAGTAAYLGGPWLAASISAAGVFVATLAAHAGSWLRQMLAWALGEQLVTVTRNDPIALGCLT